MTPTERGAYLASLEPPITDEQVQAAAHILVASMRKNEAAA